MQTIEDVVGQNRQIHSLDSVDNDSRYPGYRQRERWPRSIDDCVVGMRTLLRLLERIAVDDPQFRQTVVDRLRSVVRRGGYEQSFLPALIEETLTHLGGRPRAEIMR